MFFPALIPPQLNGPLLLQVHLAAPVRQIKRALIPGLTLIFSSVEENHRLGAGLCWLHANLGKKLEYLKHQTGFDHTVAAESRHCSNKSLSKCDPLLVPQ